MSLTSAWDPSFEGISEEEIHAFNKFRQTLDFGELCRIACVTRLVPDDACTIDQTVFQRGSCNVVYELCFADGVSWIARVRLPRSAWLHSVSDQVYDAQSAIAKSEIDVMGFVKTYTSIPIPTIFHYDLREQGNPVGAPYLLMEGIHGHITPSVFPSLDPRFREKVYRQLAGVFLQLSSLSFPSVGLPSSDEHHKITPSDWFDDFGEPHPPCQSASTYYEYVYNSFEVEAAKSDDRDRQAVARLFRHCGLHVGRYSPKGENYPLCHGDFTSGNFLWDDEFNLVAVIDWTNTMTMPWEIVGVVHEFYSGPDDHCSAARHQFADILAEEEAQSDYKTPISSWFSSPLAEILTIIKECDVTTSAAMYHVPRILEILADREIETTLNQISPTFVERAKTLRHNIQIGMRPDL